MENYEKKKKNPFVDVTCGGTRHISLEFINLRICMPCAKIISQLWPSYLAVKGVKFLVTRVIVFLLICWI